MGLIILFTLTLMLVGILANAFWLGLIGSLMTLLLSIWVIGQRLRSNLSQLLSPRQWQRTFAWLGIVLASLGIFGISPLGQQIYAQFLQLDWDRFGTIGSLLGALGQILIALLAVYVAWVQYIESKRLTTISNAITQQQTIDAYFQGIAGLMLDEEGLLEDLPMERAIAEGRTAAILGSVDAEGKAKILRFLSRSGLITPLKRDQLLGRAILDGKGVYEEDRRYGLRVIYLGMMLAGADLSHTDLRWTDLSNISLVRANFSRADMVRVNLAGALLSEACFAGADLQGVRFFYGNAETASPSTTTDRPNYQTGAFTGAVIEGADFTRAKRMSAKQRYYCCAWCGSKTRKTIPGGCEGIPNRLGR